MEEFLKPMALSQYRLAKELCVPPRRINEIVHGQRAVTADTALRLGRYFCVSPQFWLNLQSRYDLETEADRIGARVEQVSYNAVRGSSAGAGWPASGNVDATSFLGMLRARTGLAFDLPTESQWEYACRAGTSTALNSGYNLTSTSSDARMAEVGRYYYNHPGGYSSISSVSTDGGTAKAGSYLPNAWGLYDMHGNVREWCLDWYDTYPGTVSDPKGAASGSNRVFRGGIWDADANRCRSALRGNNTPAYVARTIGFRAVLPPGQP